MSNLFKIKDHTKENRLFLSRTIVSYTIVILLSCILLVRQFYLQILQHDKYSTLAQNNQVRIMPITPIRGLIYDRNGILLADNRVEYSLEVVPNLIKDFDQMIASISPIISISDKDIQSYHKQIKYKGRFDNIQLKNKLTEEEVAKFALERYKFLGIDVGAYLSRYYPYADTLSHVLGYIAPISESDLETIDLSKYRGTHVIGKDGIEKYYEKLLHGENGIEKLETDARGRVIKTLGTTSAIPGKNLFLTIDLRLQQIAFDCLGKNKGAVVAMEVENGEILVLASKPSFNSNLFVQRINSETYSNLQNDPSQPLFHRAIRGQYPPGSTIKPIVALTALDNHVIDTKSSINDVGYYKLKDEGRLFRDWKHEGHGIVNVEKAIIESCTTYFYYLGDKIGIERISEVFNNFGLGKQIGIDTTGEANGLAPSIEWKRKVRNQPWYPGETLITAIGQGYTLATPLQIANIAATIANKGMRIQPHLLKAEQDQNKIKSNVSFEAPLPVVLKNPKHWDFMIQSMSKVVSHKSGTAHRIYNAKDKYEIAGKTGTAQVFGLKQDEKYDADKLQSHLKDHAWFMAFAPVDKPKIAVAVLVEHDRGSPEIAKRVIDEYFKLYGLPQEVNNEG